MNREECADDRYAYRQVSRDTTFTYPVLRPAQGVHLNELVLKRRTCILVCRLLYFASATQKKVTVARKTGGREAIMGGIWFGAGWSRLSLWVILCVFTFGMTGCQKRILTMMPDPYMMKQGDTVKVRINATDTEHLLRVDYTIGGSSGSTTSVPTIVTVNLCKSVSSYPLTLSIEGQAFYDDNEVVTHNTSYDLTVGDNDREDHNLTFDVYVAHNGGSDEELEVDMAARFKNEFDAYTLQNYFWAEDYFYTTNSQYYANGHDLTLSFGHGSHHAYYYDHAQGVDLSTTAYGNFVPCGASGDAEYLAFAACEVLKLTDFGNLPYWWYWFHMDSTKHEARPFSGLHMVLGFRTNFSVMSYWWGYWRTPDGKDFVHQFANKMDQGWNVRTAWLDAASDELSHRHGRNMAAALYPTIYENDTVYSTKDDYIFPNPNATNATVAYLE